MEILPDEYLWMSDEEAADRYFSEEALSNVMRIQIVDYIYYNIDESRDLVFFAVQCRDDSIAKFYTEKHIWDLVINRPKVECTPVKVDWTKEGF